MTLLLVASSAEASDYDGLRIYAVTVNRTPRQVWGPGHGVYLGNGLVLTAAHVVGRAFWTRPKVLIGAQEFSTETVKEGSFEGTDLTLLRIDVSRLPMRLALRRNPVCEKDRAPGQQVASVTGQTVVLSKVLSSTVLPPDLRRYRTIIANVESIGASGTGVFALEPTCLLGIMSRKISGRVAGSKEMRDLARYIVPASEIREFVPADYRNP